MYKPNARRSTLKRFIKGLTKKEPAKKATSGESYRSLILHALGPKVEGSTEQARANKVAAKKALAGLGSPNVSRLDPQYYGRFYTFVLNLPLIPQSDEN